MTSSSSGSPSGSTSPAHARRSGSRWARRVLTALRDLAREGSLLVETRCDRGAKIVTMLEFPDAAADAVRYLDEHWDGRGQPYKLAGDAIPILARIACLAQTADVFITQDGLDAAREMVRVRRG